MTQSAVNGKTTPEFQFELKQNIFLSTNYTKLLIIFHQHKEAKKNCL